MTPLEAASKAVEREIMGYTRDDGVYVQGAVNFWDDTVESGEQIARAAGEALLDVEVMAKAMFLHEYPKHSWENAFEFMRTARIERAKAICAVLLP